MIKIDYEVYKNDYSNHMESKTFDSLNELEDWLFSLMCQNYSENETSMFFFVAKRHEEDPDNIGWQESELQSLKIKPEYIGGIEYFIKKVEKNGKIIFSDGSMTAGQKHWSKEFREWMLHCYDRQMHPVFDFED